MSECLASRLVGVCLRLLVALLERGRGLEEDRLGEDRSALHEVYARLKIWAADYDIEGDLLDRVLEFSEYLKEPTVSFLIDLAEGLRAYESGVGLLGDSADEIGAVHLLLQSAGREPLGDEERGYEEGTDDDESESESRSSGDDESESESQSSECSAIHDIQDAVDSLYNLSPALNFFLETFSPPDTVETVGLGRMIRYMFPRAEAYLIERLSIRIAGSREKLAQPASFQDEARTGTTGPLPKNPVQRPHPVDSGLGSSIPTMARPSERLGLPLKPENLVPLPSVARLRKLPGPGSDMDLCETQSTVSSQRAEITDRLPPMPEGARKGSFICNLCSRQVNRLFTPKVWRMHVFEDIQPYICIHKDCSSANTPYGSVQQCTRHHQLSHPKEYHAACPLCGYQFELDRNEIKRFEHIFKHMERIGLFSLPPHLRDTDDEGCSLSSASNARSEASATGITKPEETMSPESLIWGRLKKQPVERYDNRKIKQWADDKPKFTDEIPSEPAATPITPSVVPDTTHQPETKEAPLSLWREALHSQSLEPEHRILLEDYVGEDVCRITHSIEENIIRIENERKGKERKILFLGDVIVMKDIAMKILHWVHKFREIGDIAIQSDPIHAALPWAAFRFLLKVCVEKEDVLDAILIGLEKTACIIARCAIYESFYLNGARTEAVDNLQKSTVKLYTAILTFVAKAIAKSKEGHFKAAFTIELTSNYFDDVKELEETVEKDAAAAGAHYTANNFADLRLILSDLHTTSSRIGPQVDEVLQLLEDSMRSEILKWISTIPYTEHHTRISTTRLPGTGEWLFQKGEYKEWLSSSVSRVLLLRGIPGAGKTFIASVAIDSFSSDARLGKLAYFYCSRAEESRRDPETILSALIHQLVRTESDKKMRLKPIVDAYELRKSQGQQNSRLSLLESQALLVKLTDVYEQTTICIDALDEVDPFSRKNLLRALKFIMENSKSLVKIFVTTRMDVDIVRQFEMFPRIELQPDDNASDIERFIKESIETCIKDGELLDGVVSDDLRAEICKVLGARSRGMFQLAALQITYLYGMTTEKEVRNGLRRLPDTLRNAYQQIYERILAQQPEARKRALNAFRWIKFSCEPVQSETLLDAVSVDISISGEFSHHVIQPNVLLKACQNLIVLDKSLNVFRFAHLSVDEFFDAKLTAEESHTEIAQACLSLICTPKAWENYDASCTTREGQYGDRHLLLYSAVFWPWHFAHAKNCAILDTIWSTFVSGTHHRRWWDYCAETVKRSIWGRSTFWERVSAHGVQTNSLLSCVCVFDISQKFVDVFDLSHPSTINMNGLLSTACHFGDLEISRLLIDKGADITAADKSEQTPLHEALLCRNEAVARLLISKVADVTTTDKYGRTPLHLALIWGNEEVMRLLIDKGADVTAADKLGRTHLHEASRSGNEDLVRLLIDKSADVTAVDESGRTPLHEASESGNEDLVRLLVDKGAAVTAADKNGRTPLHEASLLEHEGVVRLLIDKGADVTAADKDGRTSLHEASNRGNERVVRLLIDKGADVRVADEEGQTPLFLIERRIPEMALALFDNTVGGSRD